MKYSTIESFISFCDDMMIAEESFKEMNKLFDKQFKAIENIKKEINISKGDYKKQIMLYKKGCNILKDLKSKVSGMDETQLEKNMRVVKTILGVAATVAAGVGAKVVTGSNMVGIAASGLTGSALSRTNDKFGRKNKIVIIQTIDSTIDQFELCIKTLNNPKYRNEVSAVSNGSDATEKIAEIKIKDVMKSVQPLINKIKADVANQANKIASANNAKVKTTIQNDDYEKHTECASMIIVDDNTESIKTNYYDLWDSFDEMFDRIADKYKEEISKYEKDLGCTIDMYTYSDDVWCIMFDIELK